MNIRDRVYFTNVYEFEFLRVGQHYSFMYEPDNTERSGVIQEMLVNRTDGNDLWVTILDDADGDLYDLRLADLLFEEQEQLQEVQAITPSSFPVQDDGLFEAAIALDSLARIIHQRNVNAGWWTDLSTGQRKERNMGELLCLVHSEISEALEGHRKSLPDDKLPQYPMLLVELVDALIREFDIIGSEMEKTGLSLTEIFLAKANYNAVRSDHKPEARLAAGGKSY